MEGIPGILKFRAGFGRQTVAYPEGPARFPERFRGLPVLDASAGDGGRAGAAACPTDAVRDPGTARLAIDLGRCTFCGLCEEASPGAIRFTRDYRISGRTRDELTVDGKAPLLARALDEKARKLFGRSLRLRQVSAAGCNGCEAELNASGNVQFDMSRFGVAFVASPRHADGIVVTGPEVFRLALAANGLGWLVAPTRWPGLACITEASYRCFARHRVQLSRRFGGIFARLTPVCDGDVCQRPGSGS